MSTPWLGVLVVGDDGDDVVDLTARVLSRAVEELPVPLRHRVPIVIAVTDYCVAGTSGLVRRYDQVRAGGRRLRPSEATSPEPARILQGFAARSGWAGSGHLLASRCHASRQALRWAYGAVSADRVEAMIVCELVREPTRDAYLVAAVPVFGPRRDATTVSRLPQLAATGTATGQVATSLLLQVAGRARVTPETRNPGHRPAAADPS